MKNAEFLSFANNRLLRVQVPLNDCKNNTSRSSSPDLHYLLIESLSRFLYD